MSDQRMFNDNMDGKTLPNTEMTTKGALKDCAISKSESRITLNGEDFDLPPSISIRSVDGSDARFEVMTPRGIEN